VEPGEPVLVGVGGSHYVPKMGDLALKRRVAFGHMLPGYQVDAGVDAAVVREMVAKTPEVSGFVLDDRGYRGDVAPVVDALEAAGLKRVRGRALVKRDTGTSMNSRA
jgi:D-aminoacyl-tRNA deacylase